MRVYIGIDPGATGALAVLNEDYSVRYCVDYDRPRCSATLREIKSLNCEVTAFIEKVHAMPKQGVVSMFHFGENFGWWQGNLDSLGFIYQLVDPHRWQNHFGLVKTDTDPKPSLNLCRRVFPTVDLHLKKHNGRSDALCIASYGYDWYHALSPETVYQYKKKEVL